MRINSIIQDSIVDGKGLRLVLFMQGCSRHCTGCHNPSTWNKDKGFKIDEKAIVEMLVSNPLIDGITISGGEPFEQYNELLELILAVRCFTDKDIWVYTGYKYEELLENPYYSEILKYIDVLVDGPYIEEQRTLSIPFKGSYNQRIIDVQMSLHTGEVRYYLI